MGVTVIEVHRLDNPDALEVLVLPGLISHLGSVLSAKVTSYLRSSIPHIYAAGDAAGRRQLTPVAAYEGRIVALNALLGDSVRADRRLSPR